MKFIIAAILFQLMLPVWAAEVSTDCPAMNHERVNKKVASRVRSDQKNVTTLKK